MNTQLTLDVDVPPVEVRLSEYDWIVVNSSAGKDSMAMLDVVAEKAQQEDVLRKVVVVHCDLGRVEWPGTRELAQKQAERYALPFLPVKRTQNDLLDHIEQRGMFPSPRQRYCTSDHKRAPVHCLLTKLARQTNKRHVRILNCMGMRAEESPARAKRKALAPDLSASNGRRAVDTWLPLHLWKEAQVWKRIYGSVIADLIHPAYVLGMPRLSCVFCIFAPKAALVLAGKHNPELLKEYERVEQKTGHRFRVDVSMKEVAEAVQSGKTEEVNNWRM